MSEISQALDLPDAILVADAGHDRVAVGGAPDLPGLDALGFTRLGTVWFATGPGARRPVDATRAVHVGKYRDAFAFADPGDPTVPLRVLSVLQSGALAETVVVTQRSGVYEPPSGVRPRPTPLQEEPAPPPPAPPEDDEPPTDPLPRAVTPPDEADLRRAQEERTSRELLEELGVEIQGNAWTSGTFPAQRSGARKKADRPAARVTPSTDLPEPEAAPSEASEATGGEHGAVDRWLATLEAPSRSARFPSLPDAGLHRQVLDADDPETVWLAHRGFLRRIQGQHDEVVDHASIDLFRAAFRRIEHVRLAPSRRQGPNLTLAVDVVQNTALAAPALFALLLGAAWWMALALGAFTVGASLGSVHLLRTPPLRRWLAAVPVLVLLFGWLTIGWLGIAITALYGAAIVLGRETWLRPAVAHVLDRFRARGLGAPPPVPMPELLERYK